MAILLFPEDFDAQRSGRKRKDRSRIRHAGKPPGSEDFVQIFFGVSQLPLHSEGCALPAACLLPMFPKQNAVSLRKAVFLLRQVSLRVRNVRRAYGLSVAVDTGRSQL